MHGSRIPVNGAGDATDLPLAGATVALDPPYADRVELTTDGEGEVRYDADAIDWSVGDLSITAHKAGFTLQSFVNVTREAIEQMGGRLEMAIYDIEATVADATTLITGEATGMVDDGNYITLSPMLANAGTWQATGSEFELVVPRNAAFDLFALEWEYPSTYTDLSERGFGQNLLQWSYYEIPAVTDATWVHDIDFDTGKLTVQEAHPTWTFPTGADASWMSNTTLITWIYDLKSGGPIGFTEHSDLNTAGTAFEMHLKWFEKPQCDPISYYEIRDGLYDGSNTSVVNISGYPSDGEVELDFPHWPTWVTPASPRTLHSLYAPIEWENPNSGALAVLYLWRGDVMLWSVVAGEDATGATVPRPPSSLDYDQELSGYALQGQLQVGYTNEANTQLVRWASPPRLTQLAP